VKIPVSTYRLQFNRDFRFVDALRVVDYLHELGVTDLYASPILKARPGSMHGYDVTEPTQINPEIGTAAEFDQLVSALQAREMGIVLDIVPNHMAASVDNPWWFDVLEKGQESPYAAFFDVNWESEKVMLPILGKPFGQALEDGEIVVRTENGRPIVQYYEQKLPIAAGAEDILSGGALSRLRSALSGRALSRLRSASVDQVLSRQHYRLAFWRKAADGINYRRFFDITDLVALRAERDDVFQATHKYVLRLVEAGKVTGLRIDHIDGLLDPKAYLERLPEVYVVTEKILAGNEHLPCDWRTRGTTGYDFINFTNGAFIDPKGFHKLTKAYSDFVQSDSSFIDTFRRRKRQVMRELFAGEVAALVNRLSQLAEEDRHARDVAAEELKKAFVSVTASLPVYRTYIRDGNISETDRVYIEDAIAASGKGHAFDFLRRVLLVDPAWYLQHHKSDYLDFVKRWQQFTGPVMAKGLEDTTFYVHNPLVSVNEVGGDSNGPECYFGVEEFHRRNLSRHAGWPHTMNASSTHDTKRSEDVRARINVLSEFPEEWGRCLQRWRRWTSTRGAPATNEMALIFQSMLGAWPIEPDRLKQFATKALREGKTHTSWLNINKEYENRVLSFVDSLYANEEFLSDFKRFQKKIARFGALSSLSQLVLKITSPGIPDFYRGADLWDLSLVDPDNRRPVDFSSRIEMLAALKRKASPRQLLKSWADGRIKLYITWKLLTFRRAHRDLFLEGEYIPLRVTGPHSDHIVAFARRVHSDWCVVAVPRLFGKLLRRKNIWQGTSVQLPAEAPSRWTNVLTDESISAGLTASVLFATLPFAVLTPNGKGTDHKKHKKGLKKHRKSA
jgi:(1->4)-alpha-D-glucan 1-alpha-D-glucosylmutase